MTTTTPTPAWRDRVDSVQPTVLFLGGFMSSPPIYRELRDLLLARGAPDVIVAPIWTMDWLLSIKRGQAAIVTRAGRALLEASAASSREPASAGAPVLVIGHSMGGVVARILTSPAPFAGRKMNASGRIGAIVTLGTPHRMDAGVSGQIPNETALWVAEKVPGAYFAPRVGYVAVGSRAVVGTPDGDRWSRTADRCYRGVILAPEGARIEGDGLIPLESALLPGAEPIILDDVLHGFFVAGNWYGDADHVDAWWPRAVAAWRGALLARVGPDERGPDRTATGVDARVPVAPTADHAAAPEATDIG